MSVRALPISSADDSAIAGNDRGNSHAEVVLRPRLLRQVVRVGMDVDEPGSDHEPRGIDDSGCLDAGEVADLGNLSIPDGHICPNAGSAGAVDDGPSPDQEVVLGSQEREEQEQVEHGINDTRPCGG